MTLAIIVYVPDGIVLASDSRQFITMEGIRPDGVKLPPVEFVNSDSNYKTFLLEGHSKQEKEQKITWQVGISTFGRTGMQLS